MQYLGSYAICAQIAFSIERTHCPTTRTRYCLAVYAISNVTCCKYAIYTSHCMLVMKKISFIISFKLAFQESSDWFVSYRNKSATYIDFFFR